MTTSGLGGEVENFQACAGSLMIAQGRFFLADRPKVFWRGSGIALSGLGVWAGWRQRRRLGRVAGDGLRFCWADQW